MALRALVLARHEFLEEVVALVVGVDEEVLFRAAEAAERDRRARRQVRRAPTSAAAVRSSPANAGADSAGAASSMRVAGRRPNHSSSSATRTIAPALTNDPAWRASVSSSDGGSTGARSRPASAAKSTTAILTMSPRSLRRPAAVDTSCSISLTCLSIASGAGLSPSDAVERRLVDQHRHRQAVDDEAGAGGGDLLGGDLVIGQFLASCRWRRSIAWSRSLRLVGLGRLASTPAGGWPAAFCEFCFSLTTRTERSTRWSGL